MTNTHNNRAKAMINAEIIAIEPLPFDTFKREKPAKTSAVDPATHTTVIIKCAL